MDQLQQLWNITKQLEKVLDTEVNGKNRDAIMEEVNDLLVKRGNLLNQISPPFTESEKQLGEKVVSLNHHIQTKMNMLFDDLKIEMKQMKKQKKSNRSYINPYENVKIADGMFMDSKK
ncbi:flagellar protein FliT [Lentibacillus sp. CBA3610]|uniref:flagellar protein FliT n=1 Tax=Lentibacillus sp. CBA3610 TaxID=2518176 RepID=UPI0015961004|nr:flagellar protein FliT [Lentibacillus sp. CBA3610]QKY69935.1 flagellar protein FliT [Lentibacillus sp. CBA3610]